MRSALRRGRTRRLRNTSNSLQYRHRTPPIFDHIEYLEQKINYVLPGDTISQAIITTDYYLAYTLNRYLFSGTRTAVLRTIESAHASLQNSGVSQLIIDMDGIELSYFATLEYLRQLIRQRSGIQIFLLFTSDDESLLKFIAMAGPFYLLSRRQPLPHMRHALLSSAPHPVQATRISQASWQMISLLIQGKSLKAVAQVQQQPYHRIIYRLNRLITSLGLPHRRRFLDLIHRLNVICHDLI